MKIVRRVPIVAVFLALTLGSLITLSGQESIFKWPQHDRSRPAPNVITPGQCGTQDQADRPPSDAEVLFNGKDLSNWKSISGEPAQWQVEDGYFQVVPGTGDIVTKQSFGSFQLHVEWATPNPAHGEDQDRGNSGIILHGFYELQVLDSYNSKTYPDGQAGAMYGQYPPLVNACRPPGKWQTYDVIFHAPHFLPNGVLMRPADVTVLQNGVLVQDHVALSGPTENRARPYSPGITTGPLRLQDHHHPVRFRNIWIRELTEK